MLRLYLSEKKASGQAPEPFATFFLEKRMSWIYLVIAGVFEVVWALGLKYSLGFTRLVPSLITIAAMAISVYLLSLAAKALPIGTAYAVWTGIGAVGAVLLGILLLGEPRSAPRLLFLALILVGIIGLKFTSPSE
jgi:quaternary ammonium compound-resistance protein SugE